MNASFWQYGGSLRVGVAISVPGGVYSPPLADSDQFTPQTKICLTVRTLHDIAETTRNRDGLYDKQRTQVAVELQSDKASLDQQKLKRETTQKLLLEALSENAVSQVDAGAAMLAFSVTWQDGVSVREIPASDSTVLQPGDVERVLRKVSPARADVAALPVSQKTQADQASQ